MMSVRKNATPDPGVAGQKRSLTFLLVTIPMP
jgi:hypothetical protein